MGLKVNGEVHASVRRFDSPNVIAVVPGSGYQHEYVVYSAHWDGLGRDRAARI